jgi:hypothetical protein
MLSNDRLAVPIEQQIEVVVGVLSDFDIPELLPILRTLQFVRDNQEDIKAMIAAKRNPNVELDDDQSVQRPGESASPAVQGELRPE